MFDSFVNAPMVNFEHIQLNIQNTHQLFFFITLNMYLLARRRIKNPNLSAYNFLHEKLMPLNCLASPGKSLSNCLIQKSFKAKYLAQWLSQGMLSHSLRNY